VDAAKAKQRGTSHCLTDGLISSFAIFWGFAVSVIRPQRSRAQQVGASAVQVQRPRHAVQVQVRECTAVCANSISVLSHFQKKLLNIHLYLEKSFLEMEVVQFYRIKLEFVSQPTILSHISTNLY
jgi:hypothetical protein